MANVLIKSKDAGEGFGYREGEYLLTTYRAVSRDGAVEVRVAEQEGHRPRPERELRVELLTDAGMVVASGSDGRTLPVQ